MSKSRSASHLVEAKGVAIVRRHRREFKDTLGDPRTPDEVEGLVSGPLGIVVESLVLLPFSSIEPIDKGQSDDELTQSLGLNKAKRTVDIPVKLNIVNRIDNDDSYNY